MASKAIVTAVKDELEHYPGVDFELKNGGKHDRAVFFLNGMSRFMVLPKTASDWRADKNAVRDFRKVMGEIGARRIDILPTRKGRRTVSALAAIALNKRGLTVLIPKNSKILSRFRTVSGKPVGHWTFHAIANPEPHALPLIALRRAELPPGMFKKPGYSRGSPHHSGGWYFQASPSNVMPLVNSVDHIGSVDVSLFSEAPNELVFRLPSGVGPTPIHDAPQAPQEPHQEPILDVPATPVAKEPSVAPQDRPMVLQFPKQTVSIEAAIALLNRRKELLGNGLRFTITEGGFISAVHRIGP